MRSNLRQASSVGDTQPFIIGKQNTRTNPTTIWRSLATRNSLETKRDPTCFAVGRRAPSGGSRMKRNASTAQTTSHAHRTSRKLISYGSISLFHLPCLFLPVCMYQHEREMQFTSICMKKHLSP